VWGIIHYYFILFYFEAEERKMTLGWMVNGNSRRHAGQQEELGP
jgi:hypothetical protein